MSKTTKKDNNRKEQILGILQLFVVASILFMAYIVIQGLDDPISKALTAPALIWAGLVLVAKFTK